MRNIIALLLFSLSGLAFAGNTYNESGPGPIQDHTCQGGHNCNTTGGGGHNEQDQAQGQAQAQDQSQGQAQGQSQTANSASYADASNRNSNESSNLNLNYAEGGNANQGQSQSSSNDNSNAGNSQNINIEAAKYRKNTPTAYAPAIYSSSACTAGGLSAGASAPGFGLTIGGAKQDAQCQVRENARILSGLDANLAIMYLCANPLVDVGAVLGTSCRPSEPVVPTPDPIPVPLPQPTPDPIPVPHIDDKVKG